MTAETGDNDIGPDFEISKVSFSKKTLGDIGCNLCSVYLLLCVPLALYLSLSLKSETAKLSAPQMSIEIISLVCLCSRLFEQALCSNTASLPAKSMLNCRLETYFHIGSNSLRHLKKFWSPDPYI